METLIASKTINSEQLFFILVDECYSDNDEPFTLFVHANHYSSSRAEWARKFFGTKAMAFEYCEQQYGIDPTTWISQTRFVQEFRFEYSITDLGTPQPYLLDFEEGEVIFRFSGEELGKDYKRPALNISGNRMGLRRLAAMLLLCADSERYDSTFHIHLDDEKGFLLPDGPVTLRNPVYFKSLRAGNFNEGSVATNTTRKKKK